MIRAQTIVKIKKTMQNWKF